MVAADIWPWPIERGIYQIGVLLNWPQEGSLPAQSSREEYLTQLSKSILTQLKYAKPIDFSELHSRLAAELKKEVRESGAKRFSCLVAAVTSNILRHVNSTLAQCLRLCLTNEGRKAVCLLVCFVHSIGQFLPQQALQEITMMISFANLRTGLTTIALEKTKIFMATPNHCVRVVFCLIAVQALVQLGSKILARRIIQALTFEALSLSQTQSQRHLFLNILCVCCHWAHLLVPQKAHFYWYCFKLLFQVQTFSQPGNSKANYSDGFCSKQSRRYLAKSQLRLLDYITGLRLKYLTVKRIIKPRCSYCINRRPIDCGALLTRESVIDNEIDFAAIRNEKIRLSTDMDEKQQQHNQIELLLLKIQNQVEIQKIAQNNIDLEKRFYELDDIVNKSHEKALLKEKCLAKIFNIFKGVSAAANQQKYVSNHRRKRSRTEKRKQIYECSISVNYSKIRYTTHYIKIVQMKQTKNNLRVVSISGQTYETQWQNGCDQLAFHWNWALRNGLLMPIEQQIARYISKRVRVLIRATLIRLGFRKNCRNYFVFRYQKVLPKSKYVLVDSIVIVERMDNQITLGILTPKAKQYQNTEYNFPKKVVFQLLQNGLNSHSRAEIVKYVEIELDKLTNARWQKLISKIIMIQLRVKIVIAKRVKEKLLALCSVKCIVLNRKILLTLKNSMEGRTLEINLLGDSQVIFLNKPLTLDRISSFKTELLGLKTLNAIWLFLKKESVGERVCRKWLQFHRMPRLTNFIKVSFQSRFCFAKRVDGFLYQGTRQNKPLVMTLLVDRFDVFPRSYNLRAFTIHSGSLISIDASLLVSSQDKHYLEQNLAHIANIVNIVSKDKISLIRLRRSQMQLPHVIHQQKLGALLFRSSRSKRFALNLQEIKNLQRVFHHDFSQTQVSQQDPNSESNT